MSCPQCHAELPSSTRFCPGCGSPGQVAVETRSIDLDAAAAPEATSADPYPVDEPASRPAKSARRAAPPTGATAVLAPSPDPAPAGPSISERLAPAADVARDRARHWARRFEGAPAEVRVAVVGALVTVVSFLLLPYVAGSGAPVEISGRLWWRPILAVAATVLLAAALARPARASTSGNEVPRRTDGLLAAVTLATAGVTEAGLLGLLAGDVVRPRAGFYGMLLGLVAVLVAVLRSARRTLR